MKGLHSGSLFVDKHHFGGGQWIRMSSKRVFGGDLGFYLSLIANYLGGQFIIGSGYLGALVYMLHPFVGFLGKNFLFFFSFYIKCGIKIRKLNRKLIYENDRVVIEIISRRKRLTWYSFIIHITNQLYLNYEINNIQYIYSNI